MYYKITPKEWIILIAAVIAVTLFCASCGSSHKTASKTVVKTDSGHVVKSNEVIKADSSHSITKDSSRVIKADSSGTTNSKTKSNYEKTTTTTYAYDSSKGKAYPVQTKTVEKGSKETNTKGLVHKNSSDSSRVISKDTANKSLEVDRNKTDSGHLSKSEVEIQKDKETSGITFWSIFKSSWWIIPLLLIIYLIRKYWSKIKTFNPFK